MVERLLNKYYTIIKRMLKDC